MTISLLLHYYLALVTCTGYCRCIQSWWSC